MVVVDFLVTDQANYIGFFEETFMLANISLEIALGMLFFPFGGADILFTSKELTQMQTTKQVKLFSTKKRVTAAQKMMIKSLCGLVSKAKNVSVIIFAKHLDDIEKFFFQTL